MITIELPDGREAVMSDQPSELTPRRRREIEIVATRLGRLLEPLVNATRILVDGDVIEDRSSETKDDDSGELVFDGGDVNITEQQLRLLTRLNDATCWALLRSWTLDIPLPATPDELLDIEQPGVYDALRVAAAKINVAMGKAADRFGVDAVEDSESPTGD